MRDYDSLVREQSSTQSQMYAAQDSNAALQEQINRLEAAKRLVSLEESEYDRVMLNAQTISYGYYQWKGENFNGFRDDTENLMSECRRYSNAIDNVLDSINSKITELKNRMDENNGLIGWCQSRLRDLGTMIENFFN